MRSHCAPAQAASPSPYFSFAGIAASPHGFAFIQILAFITYLNRRASQMAACLSFSHDRGFQFMAVPLFCFAEGSRREISSFKPAAVFCPYKCNKGSRRAYISQHEMVSYVFFDAALPDELCFAQGSILLTALLACSRFHRRHISRKLALFRRLKIATFFCLSAMRQFIYGFFFATFMVYGYYAMRRHHCGIIASAALIPH